MKKGWQAKTLGDVCVIDKNQGIHRGLPYVGLEHIESHTGRFIGSTEPIGVKSNTFKFSAEHVLYGRLRPYLNKIMMPNFTGHCSTEIFPLKPKQGVSRNFLQYWFLRDETIALIDATSTGARMPRANRNAVVGFDFPVPPFAERKRIVGILDQAFEGIATAKANAEKNLQNARELLASHVQSTLNGGGAGWMHTTIGDQLALQRGFDITKTQQSKGVVPVVSSGGIKSFHDIAMVQGPGVVIGRKGTLGKAFYVRGDFWPHDTTLWVRTLRATIRDLCIIFRRT